MRTRMVLVLCAVLALSVGVATATAGDGGNSANAKKCQKGGWKTFVRSEDGSSFANQAECVSYAAKGGTLTAKRPSQLDCESFGGIFATGTDPVLWTCQQWENTGLQDFISKVNTLLNWCSEDVFAAGFRTGEFRISVAGSSQIPGSNTSECRHT